MGCAIRRHSLPFTAWGGYKLAFRRDSLLQSIVIFFTHFCGRRQSFSGENSMARGFPAGCPLYFDCIESSQTRSSPCHCPRSKPSQRPTAAQDRPSPWPVCHPFSYDFVHHQWQPNQAHAKSCFVAGTRIPRWPMAASAPSESLQTGNRCWIGMVQSNRDPGGRARHPGQPGDSTGSIVALFTAEHF